MDPTVLVAGETLVDFIADEPSSLADVERFDRRPGGAPANVAVRLAQLGHPPWFWTRVGADPFGDFLVDTLAERGVPRRFVERDADAKTSLAFASGDPSSDPSFTFYRDGTADTRLQPRRVGDDVLDEVDWVVIGGVALASSPTREAVCDLAERAGRHDCTVVFDPNRRPELWAGAAFEREVGRVLPDVDVVKTSADDLVDAGFPADPTQLATALHGLGVHTVFQTLGAGGARASATDAAPWGPGTATHDGYAVEAVDATGAGDAFTAGVVASLVAGEADLGDVLARANAVAAASTTRVGGMADLPDPAGVVDASE